MFIVNQFLEKRNSNLLFRKKQLIIFGYMARTEVFQPRPAVDPSVVFADLRATRMQAFAQPTLAPEGELTREDVIKRTLTREFRRAQSRNPGWIEERLALFRRTKIDPKTNRPIETDDPLIDWFVVDSDGRLVSGPGSSWRAYLHGKDFPPTMDDMLKHILGREDKELLYPLAPYRDAMLVWLACDEDRVKTLIEGQLAEGVQVRDYPLGSGMVSHVPDTLRMAWVRGNKVSHEAAAASGIIQGTVGFWEHAGVTRSTYIPRVNFEQPKRTAALLPDKRRKVVVSPLGRNDVIITGGVPIDERHRDEVSVIRVDPKLAANDFIATALTSASEQFERPTVLKFNSYQPWFGKYPHAEPGSW